MSQIRIDRVAESWQAFRAASGFGQISTDAQYDNAVSLLDQLDDLGAMAGGHPLNDLFALVADAVHKYDQEHFPLIDGDGIDTLQFLMSQHDLKQTDLAKVIGSQGIVSDVLSRKRSLNKGHIEALSAHFSVSPAVFFSSDLTSFPVRVSAKTGPHFFSQPEPKMKSKVTSKPAATSASRTLSKPSSPASAKVASGSALSQRKAPNKQTSAPAATKASQVLRDAKQTKSARAAAGSAMSQKAAKKKA